MTGLAPGGDPGPDVVDVARLFSARRLQLGRQARAMTRTQLADALDVSAAAVSQFELGHAKPSPATVEKLATHLQVPLAFFSSASRMADSAQAREEVVDGFGHFRSLRSLTAIRRRKTLTVAHLLRDVMAFLETYVALPDQDLPTYYGASSAIDVVDVARRVRDELGVPEGPLVGAVRLLEQHGVVCARYPFDEVDVSAFSVPARQRSLLVLKRYRSARTDRDRFSACHELAHLVLHEPGEVLASKEVEGQANRFAAAFLMPAEQIAGELPATLDWPELLRLKSRWGVSVAALLKRASDLGVMPTATYVQAMRTMSARGWRKEEPGSVSQVEEPALIGRALELSGQSIIDVSQATGWPMEMIDELITESTVARPRVQL